MYGFLAAGTFLVVLAVVALAYKMGCEGADFDGLLAFETDGEHGTRVEEVHVQVVFLGETFVELFAEWACSLVVLVALRHLYELILD